MSDLRHAVFTPNFGTFGDAALLADLAERSEAAGWDAWFLWDHVIHRHRNEVAIDPWMALAVMAARTERIRLGTMITPVPRRRPWNLSRQVVTLDRLSAGRAVLGVGIGATGTGEFDSFGGEEADEVVRGEMLDEGLELIADLWSGRETNHSGPHYRVEGVTFRPVPVQDPIPVWVAAVWPHRRPLVRAARFQGVMPLGLPGPSALARVRELAGEGKDIAVKPDGRPLAEWEHAGATWMVHELDRTMRVEDVERAIGSGPGER